MSEQLEEELFALKSKFLREIPHPKLIQKAINQTKKMISANASLAEYSFEHEDLSLKEVLEKYISETLAIKLKISKSAVPEMLYQALNELYACHIELIKVLSKYLPNSQNFDDFKIKMSEPIDSYLILKRIESIGLKEIEIKPYICEVIKKGSLDHFDVLTLACLRCRKILENEGSV